jgi:hypothetical protein
MFHVKKIAKSNHVHCTWFLPNMFHIWLFKLKFNQSHATNSSAKTLPPSGGFPPVAPARSSNSKTPKVHQSTDLV